MSIRQEAIFESLKPSASVQTGCSRRPRRRKVPSPPGA